ncbi:MAG: sulfurtransferase TusA family protein [Planctomycetota bacterium]
MSTGAEQFPRLGEADTAATPERTAALVAAVRELSGEACATCGAPLCGHDAVLSIVLGYRRGARCHACLADAMGEEVASLVPRVYQYVSRRECYREGWAWADRAEGFARAGADLPACVRAGGGAVAVTGAPTEEAGRGAPPASMEHAAEYDAGDMGCGDLILELRLRMKGLAPGEVLRLTATDPGAPSDIPAWCQLTGHVLRGSAHPRYWIQRKQP